LTIVTSFYRPGGKQPHGTQEDDGYDENDDHQQHHQQWWGKRRWDGNDDKGWIQPKARPKKCRSVPPPNLAQLAIKALTDARMNWV